MADLDAIVSIVISRAESAISRASFSIPLIAAYHTHWADRIRRYTASTMLATMIQEGFTSSDAAYLAAAKILAQSPRPRTIKIGRLDTTWTQSVKITPVLGSTGDVFNGTVNGLPWTYTQGGGDNLAAVVAGIAAAITALAGVSATSTDTASTVTVLADSVGKLFNLRKGTGLGAFKFSDVTAAGNIAAELSNLRAEDPNWYGLVIDRTGEASINAAADWAETDKVLFAATSADSGIYTSDTTDVASDNAARKRTAVFAHKDYDSFFGAAMLGLMLPFDPGTATWAHKSPALVLDPKLTATEQANALAKKANILVTVAGLTDVQWGTTGTDYIDNVQSEDWVRARMQEDVYAFLRSSPKIPYTDRSVARLVETIRAVIQEGQERGVIADSPAPIIEAPLVSEVSPTDRANRLLPDVSFSFRLAGAIHTVEITGLISV